MSNISIDNISQFFLRPPEFVMFIDNFGHYFCWFEIYYHKKSSEGVTYTVTIDLKESKWINCIQRETIMRVKTITEII